MKVGPGVLKQAPCVGCPYAYNEVCEREHMAESCLLLVEYASGTLNFRQLLTKRREEKKKKLDRRRGEEREEGEELLV